MLLSTRKSKRRFIKQLCSHIISQSWLSQMRFICHTRYLSKTCTGRRFFKQLAVKLELVLFFLRPLTVAYYSGAGISIVAFASVTAWSVGACCWDTAWLLTLAFVDICNTTVKISKNIMRRLPSRTKNEAEAVCETQQHKLFHREAIKRLYSNST